MLVLSVIAAASAPGRNAKMRTRLALARKCAALACGCSFASWMLSCVIRSYVNFVAPAVLQASCTLLCAAVTYALGSYWIHVPLDTVGSKQRHPRIGGFAASAAPLRSHRNT